MKLVWTLFMAGAAALVSLPTAIHAQPNMYETAVSLDPELSYLVRLVQAAGFVEALSTGLDDVTLFAPLNSSFVDEELVTRLETPAWRQHTQNLLLHHLINGRVTSQELLDFFAGSTDPLVVDSLNGEPLSIELDNADIIIDEMSTVSTPDVNASNGLIHLVQGLLEPDWLGRTIVGTAEEFSFGSLVQALEDNALDEALNGPGPFTLFAPPDVFLDIFLATAEPERVTEVLQFHVVPDQIVTSEMIQAGGEFPTLLEGKTMVIEAGGSYDGIPITPSPLLANNGVVYVTTGVLQPPNVTEEPVGNLVQVLQGASPEFDTLVSLVVAADYVDVLSNILDVTLFAPLNSSFDLLPQSLVENLQTTDWKLHTQNLLLHHLINGISTAEDLFTALGNDGSTTIDSLNGEPLTVDTVNGTDIFINTGSRVATPDIGATNALIHAIEAVLLPFWASRNVVETLEQNSLIFSSLSQALVDNGLDTVLSNPEGEFTIFAPINAVLDPVLASADPAAIPGVLQYHVVPRVLPTEELVPGAEFMTVQGDPLVISSDGRFNGQVAVSNAFLLGNNGIVYILSDGVLLPPEAPSFMPSDMPSMMPSTNPIQDNLVEALVRRDPEYATLVDLVELAGLADTLATTLTSATLFAPTNMSFDMVDADLLTALQTPPFRPHLRDLLLLHVVNGTATSSADILATVGTPPGSFPVTTLSDDTLTVAVTNTSDITVNDAPVVEPDIQATNGIIHGLGKVILPTWTGFSVLQLAQEDDDFSTLTTAIVDAMLADTLNGPGPYTLLAPPNMFLDPAVAGLSDPSVLPSILMYHVIPGVITADMVVPGAEFDTLLAGETIEVAPDGQLNGNVPVSDPDYLAKNGLVHILGGVLLPPSMTATQQPTPMAMTAMTDAPTPASMPTTDAPTPASMPTTNAPTPTQEGAPGPPTTAAPTSGAAAKIFAGTLVATMAATCAVIGF